MWMIELVRGAVKATIVEHQPGERPLHVKADCDPRVAAERSVHGMSIPFPAGHERNAQCEVWLDPHGRIERLRAFLRVGEPDEVVKEWTSGTFELTLRDLGSAAAPAPPALD